MTTVRESGFTIIEVMLFLAVSGALFVALIIGVGGSIRQQEYRESVTSYSTMLKEQYSEAANIENDRDNNWACTGSVVNQITGGGQPTGTTDCVILGRSIQVKDNGTTVETSSVIGTEPANYADMSDVAALQAFNPKVSSFDSQTYPIDWGSSLVTTAQQPSTASILILRSPASGLIRVFTSSVPNSDITQSITSANATTVLKNCVEGDKALQATQSVSIDPRITSSDGVIVNGTDTACP